MQVVIRTDASPGIGTGHVMRCLVLADLLRQADACVSFVCRPGNMNDYMMSRHYPVAVLDGSPMLSQEEDADATAAKLDERGNVDWLIVDHYGLDARWESRLANRVGRILVIDDLANRPHCCDLLLDQYDMGSGDRYAQRTPASCRLLLGLRYLLLNHAFIRERRRVTVRSGEAKKLFVFYGGSDPTGETEKALDAVQALGQSWQVDVVIGRANPRGAIIRELCQSRGFILHTQTADMARFMANADLALGAGGVSLWERCYLGLPSLVTTVADNQRLSVAGAARYGAVWDLGWHEVTTSASYRDSLAEALRAKDKLSELSERSLRLTASAWNGNGRHPVVEEILRLTR